MVSRLVRSFPRSITVASFALLAACGGHDPAPATPAAAPASPAPSATPAPTPDPPPPAPAPAPAADPSPAEEDPNESPSPIAMTVEIDKKTPKASFPKSTTSDAACWQSLSLTGKAEADFDTLAASCGKPTGMLEYAKPEKGHLRSTNDKRDTFTLKLAKGLCYRYFAVADAGIKDLDILVEKPGGALLGDDKQNGPVAIIQSDGPWCMTEDQELEFHVEVDGVGAGNYVFGAWARPKAK